MIRDMPMHGRRVGIYIDTRRFRCRICEKTFYEPLPEVNEKRLMTQRLVDWIGKQAVKRTFSSIAEEVGIDEKTVRLVFGDYVNALEQSVRFETRTSPAGLTRTFSMSPPLGILVQDGEDGSRQNEAWNVTPKVAPAP